MSVVRLPNVDQGQHHENKGLQRNNQNVEDGPDRARDDVADGQQNTGQAQSRSTAHERDQHEYQFASVHVAKESHAV